MDQLSRCAPKGYRVRLPDHAAVLRALGRDPAREPELEGTAERVVQAFADDLCKGYELDVEALFAANVIVMKTGKTEVVALRDIAVATMRPPHLMPATGFGTMKPSAIRSPMLSSRTSSRCGRAAAWA
jgi:hypothetical protein